jgi:hypothetical protein
MAIGNDQITVGVTATAIITDDYDGQHVIIKNGTDTVCYLGDSDVSISNGFPLGEDEKIELFLGPGEEIYGIVEEDPATVSFIASMNQ